MVLRNAQRKSDNDQAPLSSTRHVGMKMNGESEKYYEDYLKKKEGKSKWAEFWVVLQNNWLIFYSNRDTTIQDNYKGCIDITMGSKCVTGKRKTYSFPFVLMTKKGKHLFKCESTVQRHKWMYAIGLVSKRSPPAHIPSSIVANRRQTEDGVYLGNWNTTDSNDKDNNSDDNSDDDNDIISDDDDNEDDDVIPPGILIVSEPVGEADDARKSTITRSSFTGFCALSSTGLGGVTVVKDHKPKIVPPTIIQPQKSVLHPLQQRVQTTPKLGSTSWISLDEARPRTSHESPLSSGRFLSASRDVRPNSSPEMGSKINLSRDLYGTPLSTKSASQLNACFSRHLVKSAPHLNLQIEEL